MRHGNGRDRYQRNGARSVNGKHSPRRRNARAIRSMNFEKYASEGNRFVNLVSDEMGMHRNVAARMVRAVLHAVRDRLPPDDAVQFGQGLPMVIKAVYFDQYDISDTPVVIRQPDEFTAFVCSKDHPMGFRDLPGPEFVEIGIHAVFVVMEKYMDYGQVEQVRRVMNTPIAEMMY